MNRRSKSLLFLLLIFAGALSFAAQTKGEKQQAQALRVRAADAYNKRNFRESATLYTDAIKLDPGNGEANYFKGASHGELKEYDAAIAALTVALNLGYKPPSTIALRYYLYYQQGTFDLAVEDIKRLMKLTPKDLELNKSLGEAQLARKAYPEAVEALKKATVSLPKDADVQYNLARVYYATGDTKAQQEAARAALTMGTRFPGESHFLHADALNKQGNRPAAIVAYQKALSSKPGTYEIYGILAELFRSEGRLDDAIAVTKKGLENFVADGKLYTRAAYYYSLADRPADAVSAAKSATALLPNQAEGYSNLCRAYNEVREFKLAITACNNALRLAPGDGETHFYLGRAMSDTDKDVEATRQFRLAVTGLANDTTRDPQNSDRWYLLGNAYFADQQRDKAVEAYGRALAISPRFAKARFNLGVIHVLRKNKPGALEQHQALTGLDIKLASRLKTEFIDKM